MDGSIREKFSGSKLTGKNVLSAIGFMAVFSLLVGGGLAATSGSQSVGIGSNGVHIYQGTLNVDGNDIEDAGTTIWDASAGNIATAVVDYSAATASDVGLGSVRNVDIANTAGDYLSYDTGFNTFNVNKSAIDTTVDGCSNCLEVGNEVDSIVKGPIRLNGFFLSSGSTTNEDEFRWTNSDLAGAGTDGDVEFDATLRARDNVELLADANSDSGGVYSCYIDGGNGSWNCDGTKNWIHDLNSTHDAYYSSQESPEVRAVYEGQADITNGKVNVTLPYHFSGTVSDERPSLRVQATPHSLTTVAVTKRTDDWIVIESTSQDEVTVDYRITGIREGYENKQVVRPKE